MQKAGVVDFETKVSLSRKINIGIQHVLTMVPGSITVPLILGQALNLDAATISFLVAANLFTSGIATLLQVMPFNKKIGSKVPVVLGSSFAPLGAMIMVGTERGLPTLFGAIIGSGILLFLISSFFSKILKLFPTVVVGSFVTVIGIYLAPLAIKNIGGGYSSSYGSISNLSIGFTVLLVTILLGRFGNQTIKNMSLLIGIIFGTIISLPFGTVDLVALKEAAWIGTLKPFYFGLPKFEISSILIMTIFCIINFVQCIGAYSVLEEIYETDITLDKKISGLRAVALTQIVSGIFNSVPSTMFNENAGLLKITNEKSNSVIRTAGLMLVLFAFSPKIATLVTIIPAAVIGGVTLALFGVITSAGISILSTLDFRKDNNFTIVGTSIAIGIGVTFHQDLFSKLPSTLDMLFSNGLFMVCASAIILNLVLNFKKN